MIPKFRAWDKELQCWCPYRIYSLNELGDDVVEFMYVAQEVWFTNKESGNNFILMQSTGLEDKNGVEIYGGDIVKVTDDDERTDFSDGGIGTVCGLEKIGMWYIDGQVHNGLFDINHCYYIEVIGNIYENTELLEAVE